MDDATPQTAKPCIALMGEFSAGKSTLANLLIGANPLPVQVIATQLPPVWISHGTDDPYRVDLNGVQLPVDIENLAAVPLSETTYIRIFCEEDILLQCDLLDMPGISDPNMASEVWERMIKRADGVIWCSHATQAWRQSEAAVWADMDPGLYERSILLLTRIDKVVTEDDRVRVLKRVRRETEGLFRACLPISLLQATSEQENYSVWEKSGAGEFAKCLADLLGLLRDDMDNAQEGSDPYLADGPLVMPAFEAPARSEPEPEVMAEAGAAAQIIPRRVSTDGPNRRQTARP
ncbi:dynamin family protein [Litoreibacter sp.]|nr:dynamin family protein [Litoreibacter sp.]